ncbi:protoporphyrinogen/coproporphyrinogen oxidase [Denitromonas ohlonensis]|uniref:FAD-dependent oxidoreductase n=2 Tax=Denitromonas TaxID=139331 RepID=A0A558CIU0_9RHOO|nr:FAD-dependent oxidoreductase [Denitromonas ohlonensis]TVT48680.1 MAG: FAD-dependent oxidoreductase [Denitromonas halophila]TVO63549.1 FAD-dependent oxidoreductase [Denitromonas ohlonensis]TVO75426.1 FAD-dependent oxidoreductase [Denitromonas ohlonensis]TVT70575.1 MAG: FAD-dependent oxidoreductase [Denitromonas halophila]TVT75697.1 MAG: FAD-dependent oxidoreductase [Denitromonas halophila]
MKTIVIGGGPAGCAAAYTLGKKGHEVVLFEAADVVGGRTKQLHRDGFNLGTGALFLMGGIYPRTFALLKELGKDRKVVPWAGASELQDNDDSRYRVSFVNLASYLTIPKLTLGDRLKVITAGIKLLLSKQASNAFDSRELAKYDTKEDLESWSRRNLGDRAHEYIVRPLMDFLYAVPASWLSLPFPLSIIKQANKMALSVPPEGVGQVSQWLIDGAKNTTVHVSTPVEKVEKRGNKYAVLAGGKWHDADGLVMATESFVAAKLMNDFISEPVRATLMETPYTEYAHVQIGWAKNPWPTYPVDIVMPVGFGEERNIGAMVLQSRRHPNAVPPGGEAVGVYFNTPPLVNMTDEDIKREALEGAIKAFGKAPEPIFVHLFRYDKGLTIAKPGHYERLEAIYDKMPPKVFLAGDYFSQAGVEAAVFSGERAALRLDQTLN